MDPKAIEMVDQVFSGYEKAKALYKENEEVIKKLKAWFQENKTKIIITVILLIGAGIFIYRKYQEVKQETKEVKSESVKEETNKPENNTVK
jgi:predicted negative regulator of RcsB-dependent stress response